MTGRRVLMTGATSGIGLALAKRYQQAGARLILVGRKPLELLEPALFKAEGVHYCRADLARAEAAASIETFVLSKGSGPLDLVIHNAAVGYYGPAMEQSAAELQALLEVNLYTPTELTRRLLPHIKMGGKLAFISSVAADLPAPDYAVYSASKAALSGFARSLRAELQGRIKVQLIYPGATATEMHAKSGVPETVWKEANYPSAEDVAQAIDRALERDIRSSTIGWTNTLLRRAGQLFGGPVDALVRRSRQ